MRKAFVRVTLTKVVACAAILGIAVFSTSIACNFSSVQKQSDASKSSGSETLSVSPTGATAPIQFRDLNFDFGTCEQQDVVKHKFVFKNSTQASLQSDTLCVKTSCSCTGAVVQSSSSLAPGAEGYIEVSFDTRNFSGKVDREVGKVLYKNGEDLEPICNLRFKGFINETLLALPREVVLGHIKQNQSKEQTVTISAGDSLRGVSITGAEASKSYLHVQLGLPADRVGTIKGHKPISDLRVLLAPGAPPGTFNEQITVRTTCPSREILTIPVRGVIEPLVRAYPNQLYVGRVKHGEAGLASVTVSASGRTFTLGICNQEKLPSYIDASVAPLEDNQGYRVSVRVGPESPLGILQKTLSLSTNVPELPIIEIPIIGRIVD